MTAPMPVGAILRAFFFFGGIIAKMLRNVATNYAKIIDFFDYRVKISYVSVYNSTSRGTENANEL